MSDPHFCTCTDLECSLNPNSSGCRHRNCDRCVKKNLKAGEIPNCFFKAVHEDISGTTDMTHQGFADWVIAHRGPDAAPQAETAGQDAAVLAPRR